MAGNIRQYNLERITVPICANPHNGGDFGWEGNGATGYYGVFVNSALAGASADLMLTCTARLLVPTGMLFGQIVYSPPQPTGAPVLQNTNAGSAVAIGVILVPPDANNIAVVALTPQVSMGH